MRKLIIVLTSIVLFVGFGTGVNAQEVGTPSLTIYPSIIEVSGDSEKVITESMTLRNDSSLLVPVKIEVSNYSIDSRGIPSYISQGLEWNPTDWITVEPADSILGAKEQKEISIEIRIPEGALPGSYFSAIIFKPIMPPEYFETQSTHIIPYIGAVIGINVEGEYETENTDFLSVERFSHSIPKDNSGILFSTSLRNDDVYYHKVEGDIIVTNLLDDVVVEEDVKGVTLFPESFREFENTYASRLPFGRYTATLNIEGEGDQATEEVTFWVEPTILEVIIMIASVLGAVTIIALLILLVIRRKNIMKAITILFKK